MQPIDGYYLYSLGTQVHPLTSLNWQQTSWNDGYFTMLTAQGAINALLHQSVYQVRACRQEGVELLQLITALLAEAPSGGDHWGESIPPMRMWAVIDKVGKFEAVLRAELGITPMYYVTPKNNIDVVGYINSGHLSFPPDLALKVPEAVPDAQQAAKCIAFDLPTAAGFHLHRANESVLRRYFDQVAGAENRPPSRNMGDYLNKMKQLNKGDPKVRAALRDLKDLHRNPLMHPEEHISSADDAISLMGQVRGAMSLMLKELPTPPPLAADAIAAILDEQKG